MSAETQGRQAYAAGKPRNPAWPAAFLAAYDRAAEDDRADAGERRGPPRLVTSDAKHFERQPE